VTRRGIRWFLGGAVALLTLVVAAPLARADGNTVFIRSIDSTDPTKTQVQYVATGADGPGAQITVNGTPIPPSSVSGLFDADPKPDVGIALVVDTGPGMGKDSSALVNLKDGLKSFVQTVTGQGVQVAIYQGGDSGVLVQSFTSDAGKLTAGIDRLTPSNGSAVWSAIRQAGGALGAAGKLQPNLIVAAGDEDQSAATEQSSATGSVLSAGASVFTLSYTGAGMDPTPYNDLVAQAGGMAQTTADPAKMADLLGTSQQLLMTQQFQSTIDTGLKVGEIADVSLTVGGQTSTASVVIGGSAVGSQQLHPQVAGGAGPLNFLSNGLGLMLGLLLVLAAVAFAVYAIVLLFVPDNNLSNVLQPYADGYSADADDDDETNSAIGKSALLQRAVELTEQVAESQGYLTRAEAALERANLPLRAGEALFFYISLVFVVTILMMVLTRSLFAGLIIGIVAALIPPAVISFLAGRRRRAFMTQLPDTLQLLSGTLRAGYSLMQGVEAVSQEVDDPMGIELRRVVTEARLGRPLEESLEGTAERMDSPDFAWAVMAIRIQREVGGNLSELLMTVAETMVARERLRRDVRTLTAEGRMSAIVLGLLPLGLGAIMFLINPEYMSQLYKTGTGIVLSIVAAVSMAIGFFWMKKIIDIEI
jgi:tight adherence protein B